MAEIEPPDDLVQLQRAALAAEEAALADDYTPEGWQPWRDAATAVQAAITEWAKEAGENRYEAEMAVKKAAHPAEA